MFLKSISNYRGLAIILIVAGHMYGFGFESSDVVSSIIKNIISGSTALFVFISGFMFHYVFYKKYEYNKFIKNKLLNIGIPYLILATFAIFLNFILNKGFYNPERVLEITEFAYQKGHLFNISDSSLIVTLKYYLSGAFLTAYWYIPFALLLFATAPIHIRFIKTSKKTQIIIFLLLSILSILIHRSIGNTNPLHSLIYYTPIYLMGIFFSIYKEEVKACLTGKSKFLFVGVLALSTIEYLTGHVGNYHSYIFHFNGIDYMYIQKILLICLIYILLENRIFFSKTLDVISETSFAIFFIHPWLITIFSKILPQLSISPKTGNNNIIFYFSSLIIVIFISVIIALIIKKIFRGSKKTRYIIGY